MALFEQDIEKTGETNASAVNVSTDPASSDDSPGPTTSSSLESVAEHDPASTPVLLKGRLREWNEKIESWAGLEARGINRVLPQDKHAGGMRHYTQMFLLWVSIDVVAISIITGLLGPLVFALGWIDSVCIVIFGSLLGAAAASYPATFGPESGNRTMIVGRYFLGYWPSKLACVLNLISQLGWGTMACILAGQIISAINGAGLSIALGCVISAICMGIISVFGIRVVYRFERYAFIPQLIVIFVLIGSAGKSFDTSAVSVGSSETVIGNRCSFLTVVIAAIAGFGAVSADFYVYYPVATPKWITFTTTLTGLWTSIMFCGLVGVGIGTGVANNQAWSDAYAISSGALFLECYRGLGGFGSFCCVILALGVIGSNAPLNYTAAFSVQVLGRYGKAVPRWVWCTAVTIFELVCSVAGRNQLLSIFTKFVPIMSYWYCPWLIIAVEEHVLFHILRRVPFDWTAWEDKKRLPVGAAALVAWLVGWAGAVIGMNQVWWQGPVASRIGDYGGDVGIWLSIAFAGVIFPPLRYVELRIAGR